MSLITTYDSFSAVNWFPVSFETIGGQYTLKKETIEFGNGLNFNLTDFLSNALDITINRETVTLLSNFTNNESILESNEFPEGAEIQEEFSKTALGDFNSFVINPDEVLNGYPTPTVTSTKEPTINNLLKLKFNSDKLTIQNRQDLFLTYNNIDTCFSGNCTFLRFEASSNNTAANNQIFDYIIKDNYIMLFVNGSDYSKVVTKNTQGTFNLCTFDLLSADNLSQNYVLRLLNFNNNSNFIKNSQDSFISVYETDPTKKDKELNILEKEKALKYKQNYIGMFPIENYKQVGTDVVFPIQLHGLKNYQTPDYTYSKGNGNFTDNSFIRRKYSKIHTGTNQERGLDNIFLSYNAKTSEIIFKTNQDNFFAYPATSLKTPLSSSGLIEDGAIASSYPLVSDKIFLKQKDYSDNIPSSLIPTSVKKNGTWLCSWLSGSTNGDKAWMDRFYSTTNTLTANLFFVANNKNIWDEPSKLYLEPSVFYKYARTGTDENSDFLSRIEEKDKEGLNGTKTLHISSWNDDKLIDQSSYKNNGLIFYNKKNTEENYLNLDGSVHGVFPSKSDLLQSDALTVSLFVNVDDWTNIQGEQIFGNYYSSGFGLINDSAISAPVLSLVNTNNNTVFNLNYRYDLLSTNPIKIDGINENNFIQRFPDFGYFVFDSIKMVGHRYNADNVLVFTTGFETASSITSLQSVISSVSQVELSSDQKIYIFGKNSNSDNTIIKLSSSGKFNENSISYISNNYKRIELNSHNNLLYVEGNCSVVDNNNILWETIDNKLFKNSVAQDISLSDVSMLSCDDENNIWVLEKIDTITKIDTKTGKIIFSKRFGKNSGLPEGVITAGERYINFLKIPESINNNFANNAVIVDVVNNESYIIDKNGNLISVLNLQGLNLDAKFAAKGDFTGYQFIRKQETIQKNLSWKFKLAYPNNAAADYISLRYDTGKITKGWHLLTFTFDSKKGNAKCFIDSALVNQYEFAPNVYKLYYDYRTSLLLGASTIRNNILNDLIQINNEYKFIGKVSDLRIYNKSLSFPEIQQIYFSSKLIKGFQDMKWNMFIGERSYIEEIKHWFEMQLPGNKSKFFNIKIKNFTGNNESKSIIENSIKSNLKKIIPINTTLNKIIFQDSGYQQKIYHNTRQSYTALCPLETTGLSVVRTVDDNTFSSLISQVDANAQALALATSQANAALVCVPAITRVVITSLGPQDDDLRITNGNVVLSNTQLNLAWYNEETQIWFPPSTGTLNNNSTTTGFRKIILTSGLAYGDTLFVDVADCWATSWRSSTWQAVITWGDGTTTTKNGGVNASGTSATPSTGASDYYTTGPHFAEYHANGSFTLLP